MTATGGGAHPGAGHGPAGPGPARLGSARLGLGWQVFGFLGGMTVYAVYHLAASPLVPLACEVGSSWMITAASAVAALLIVAAMVVSWRVWRAGRGAVPDVASDDLSASDVASSAASGAGVSDQRTAFLGFTGLILNGLALAIVLSVEAHVHFLDPCLPG